MWKARVKSRLASFGRNEDGSIAMEAMIMMPAMFWAFLACFSMFDTFRTYSINQKAAYTIGDAISRETAPIDADYLRGSLEMFEYLSRSWGDSSLRVSSLRFDGAQGRFFADWSKTQGNIPELTSDEVRSWTTRLPVMPSGERVMLVETWSKYDPPFAVGFERQDIQNFVFTRPRFAPRVCWEQCN